MGTTFCVCADHIELEDVDMHDMLRRVSPLFRQGHLHQQEALFYFCQVMLQRLRTEFTRQLAALPSCSKQQAYAAAGQYDCRYVWGHFGELCSWPFVYV